MTEHKVITVRERSYPFRSFWRCVCGKRMHSTIMGSPLFREFAKHESESNN